MNSHSEQTPSTAPYKTSPLRFIGRVMRFLTAHKIRLFAMLLAILVQIAFSLVLPVFYREIFDEIIVKGDFSYLGRLALILPILLLFEIIAEIVDSAQASAMVANAMYDLRRRLYEHLQRFPMAFYINQSTSQLTARISNDTSEIERALSGPFYRLIFNGIALLGGIALMFYLQFKLAIIALVAFPLVGIAGKIMRSEAMRMGAQNSAQLATVTSAIHETVRSQRVIRAFAMQARNLERFSELLGNLLTTTRRLNRTANFVSKSSSATILIVQLLIMVAGAFLAIDGQLTAGTLVAFWALLAIMGNSARSLTGITAEIIQGDRAMVNIEELLNAPTEPGTEQRTLELQSFSGEIRFTDVGFSYGPETKALEQINLSIAAGQSVAFVGPSGSGKTTLGNLLLRFYEVSAGTISIDGLDLSKISEESLRRHIGVVFNESILFDASIRDNIIVGKEGASDLEIEEAAQAAEIHDFITSLPEGYDTGIGDMGSKLSSGQRQRLGLARALLKKPPILILDEATSALDFATAASINATLEKLAGEHTLISMNNRLSSVASMDAIFVLDAGHLVEQGMHKDLLNKKGLYHDMWQRSALALTQDVVMADVENDEMMQTELPENSTEQNQLRQLELEIEHLQAINLRWAELAGTDRLTGLPNRLSFVEALVPQEIQVAQSAGEDMALLLVSGDHLGDINERFGREQGNEVLKQLAQRLSDMLRGSEQIGHLDGVNFAFIMHPATLNEAQARAEQIRTHIHESAFVVEGQNVEITVSIGVVQLDINTVSAEAARETSLQLFNRLDAALHQAKRAGGNNVSAAA